MGDFKNKGFTLMELLVVIVIIGILILLATPKFLDYIEEAKLIHIKNDTKVVTNYVLSYMIRNDGALPKKEKLLPVGKDIIDELLIDEKVYGVDGKYNKYGQVVPDNKHKKISFDYGMNYEVLNLEDEIYVIDPDIIKDEIGSRLKGSFVMNYRGESYYIDELVEMIEIEDEGNDEETEDPSESLPPEIPRPEDQVFQVTWELIYDEDKKSTKKVEVTGINWDYFEDNPNRDYRHLEIPNNVYDPKTKEMYEVVSIGNNAFGHGTYVKYTVEDGFTSTMSVDAYISSGKVYEGLKDDQKLKSVKLPRSVKKIGACAFNNNEIEKINMYFVEEIGVAALGSNKIEKIDFGQKLRIVDSFSFNLNPIRELKFFGGDRTSIKVNSFIDSNLEVLELGQGIVRIEAQSFKMSKNLKTLILPTSIKDLGKDAFRNNDFNYVEVKGNIKNIDDINNDDIIELTSGEASGTILYERTGLSPNAISTEFYDEYTKYGQHDRYGEYLKENNKWIKK